MAQSANRLSILRREPGALFSKVVRAWDGATVVLLGGGPSLTARQALRVQTYHEADQVRVIAVNDAYRIAPFADVCYFADSEWWTWHKDRPEFRAFAGDKCSSKGSGANITDPAVHLLRDASAPRRGYGLSLDPEKLVTGSNSGFQALNLAVLAGAATVILLGYDAREPAAGQDSHWFGHHPRREPLAMFAAYRKAFAEGAAKIAAAGVRVINATPASAIEAFERADIDEALHIAGQKRIAP
jgi:hypothetical protein